ncbi:MAG: nucleotidyltransferase domain-containing protein [Mailhella sp.]|nr:nucleotidyltransferase domain-containing protein [Mailhella sp.]
MLGTFLKKDFLKMISHNYAGIIKQVEELCHEKKGELLYLTVFGSTLYGTEIEGKSDIDVRGIFLPTMESLVLNECSHSIHFTTGGNFSRNGCDDVDIDLWSLQYWLQKLLPAGDTGALDVLFSPSNQHCTLFRDPRLDAVFNFPLNFLDTNNGKACAEYSLGQAKKYGIKGSRLGALKNAAKYANVLCGKEGSKKLSVCADGIVAGCKDERFCRIDEVHDSPMLFLCGKWHALDISMREFLHRLDIELARYGQRSADAESNSGIDWKAISHAVRAIRQITELLTTGRISFPLKCREELRRIKTGQVSWEEAEGMILHGLDDLETIRATSPYSATPDAHAARMAILSCYGIGE